MRVTALDNLIIARCSEVGSTFYGLEFAKDNGVSKGGISDSVAKLSRYGILNTHTEMLPEFRTRAPRTYFSLSPDWPSRLTTAISGSTD